MGAGRNANARLHCRPSAPRSEDINILRVGLLLPPGFDVLSFAPLSVFITANSVSAESFYEAHVVSVSGGRVSNSFGMFVDTERAGDIALDTLLVGTTPVPHSPSAETTEFLQSATAKARRIASICLGAFILGDAGLLDGRRATTHWRYGKQLQSRYPNTRVRWIAYSSATARSGHLPG